jgi:hypothetical protein
VTSFGEQIPYTGFFTSPDILLIERGAPDPQGARTVMVPYGQIHALKIGDPLDPRTIRSLGFEGKQSAK